MEQHTKAWHQLGDNVLVCVRQCLLQGLWWIASSTGRGLVVASTESQAA